METFENINFISKEGINMLENNDKYFEILEDIKKTVLITRNKVVTNANKELILMYYDIGLKLIKNNKWGSSFIDTLAKDLKMQFPNLKGLSTRNLRYMQKFAMEFDNDEFLQGVLAKLPWTSITMIMDQVKDKKTKNLVYSGSCYQWMV